MQAVYDIFAMPLFPHIYAVPLSLVVGIFIGYKLRGNVESMENEFPPKPKV